MYFRSIILLCLALIQSCASLSTDEYWSDDLPTQDLFIESCQKHGGCRTAAQTTEHLDWIKRFYFGSILYPTGWNDVTQRLIGSLKTPTIKLNTKQRLDELGFKIVKEWARDNKLRLIDSRLLAIWGNALSKSAEKNEQLEFIISIESDVEQLLTRTLKSQEISAERYYPVEDYDNF
ncbi:MAG: hypothetical protein KTR16_15095 [Acidiferrobacterales bacterium]|nr:hypothetical protein [Acidiferrobacterales bacterium]